MEEQRTEVLNYVLKLGGENTESSSVLDYRFA
jgi:hypothetical protein